MRSETRHYEAALHAIGEPTIVVFPDAPATLLERYAAPHLVFSATLLDLAQTTREADAAITYASFTTTTSFLLMGKPLLLPGQLEQFLLARRVVEMGAGPLQIPEQPPLDLEAKLRSVLFDADFALNAQAFARKYSNFPQKYRDRPPDPRHRGHRRGGGVRLFTRRGFAHTCKYASTPGCSKPPDQASSHMNSSNFPPGPRGICTGK